MLPSGSSTVVPVLLPIAAPEPEISTPVALPDRVLPTMATFVTDPGLTMTPAIVVLMMILFETVSPDVLRTLSILSPTPY